MPSVAEKGYLDVHVEVTSPGGHSSVPPPHTSIGILAALLVKYEDNPSRAELVEPALKFSLSSLILPQSRDSVPYMLFQCFAAHGPQMPRELKHLVRRSIHSDKALNTLRDVLVEDLGTRSLLGTTQAIDMIQGGFFSRH